MERPLRITGSPKAMESAKKLVTEVLTNIDNRDSFVGRGGGHGGGFGGRGGPDGRGGGRRGSGGNGAGGEHSDYAVSEPCLG